MTEQQQIAETIRRQMLTGNRLVLMTIGARQLAALDANEDRRGGLTFRVTIRRQRFHKVLVELTHLDDYKVTLWGGRRHSLNGRVLEETTCQCDNLADVVNDLCEREHERLAA